MKKFLYFLVQCTWGLGQTIIGFVYFLANIRCPHKMYRCAIETRWNWHGGLSLGPFIFTPATDGDFYDGVCVHEYGHTFQSLLLGPLYAIVGVISCTWGSLIHPWLQKRKNGTVPYTACFVEYWASAWGEKITGGKAVW